MFDRIAAALLLLAMPGVSVAQEQRATEGQTLLETRLREAVAVLQASTPAEDVFAPAFLAAVPEAQLHAMNTQMAAQFGSLLGIESVEPVGPGIARIKLRFERAIASGGMQLEAGEPFRIIGLRLSEFAPLEANAEELLGELRALPGVASALFVPLAGGAPLLAHEAERPLAIGSTFKLYVLAALAQAVASGEHRWDEVVALDQRSLPSGLLQDWPRGAPLTLHTLAVLMIAQSDNTATDQLIAVLGREAVEAELVAAGHAAPERNRPFLTTREFFLLKAAEPAEAAGYAAADAAGRRATLTGLGGQAPDLAATEAALAAGPRALEVEWFASAQDIARLFGRIAALEDETALAVLGVSPALPQGLRSAWDYVGYKGGSEPGVLNLSWLLRDRAGAWHVLTLGWNDPAAPLDRLRLELMAQRVLALAGSGAE